MFGFLFSWFIGKEGPNISCTKTQTLTYLRLPATCLSLTGAAEKVKKMGPRLRDTKPGFMQPLTHLFDQSFISCLLVTVLWIVLYSILVHGAWSNKIGSMHYHNGSRKSFLFGHFHEWRPHPHKWGRGVGHTVHRFCGRLFQTNCFLVLVAYKRGAW